MREQASVIYNSVTGFIDRHFHCSFRIFHTVVLDDPYDDPDDLQPLIPDRSPEPTKDQLDVSVISNEINIEI